MPETAEMLAAAYLDDDRRQRVLHSKIGCLLALVLMPAGIALDWAVYPEQVGELLASRLLCDLGVLVVLGLLFTKFGARHIRVLGIAWALLPCAAISWMIYATRGETSPYYAGLNLVIIAVSLLMPWTVKEVLATCAITVGFYLAAVGGYHATAEASNVTLEGRVLFNNLYFISLTALITGTGSFFTGRLRYQDWRNRHQLNQRNEELNESYRKLAELDRLKSQFFANVSHELRTPLTLIIAPLEELLGRGGTGQPHADGMLTIARDNALRLLRLINELLDLVKLDEKGADIRPTRNDLSATVPGMVSSMTHLAHAKGLELSVAAGPAELFASVDADALEKIVLNLVTNAIKFTPGGGKVEVSLAGEGGNAVVRVRDTGIGISAADLPRIFDRFAQLDSSSTRKYSGIGIGLALARGLAEAHGGTLTAESELGVGTVMSLKLPLAGTETAVQLASTPDALSEIHGKARRALTVTTKQPDAVQGTGEQLVLVVEDEPDMRQFVTGLLSDNCRVAQAADGLQGLRMAQELRPQLAVLDLMLPGLDGLDLCEKLRADPEMQGLKIILLTARADEASKLTALKRGANDFLTKPFSSIELKTRVANLLAAAALERQLVNTNEELRRTLDTLRATEAQLIQSEKINALGTLAAGLLHEIYNPLNFSLAAIQIALRDSEGQAELQDTLKDIHQGMSRITEIVGGLRTFAHPEQHLNRRPVSLADAVTTARRIAGAELVGCQVVQDVNPESRVLGSEGQIVQVLINLLTNAARATREKPQREIRISSETQNGITYLRVRDNGVGIAQSELSKVFDPFFTKQEPGQGMGLGLTICQTIARNHGGQISIESVQGDWTEVTLELPSAPETGDDHAHTAGLS